MIDWTKAESVSARELAKLQAEAKRFLDKELDQLFREYTESLITNDALVRAKLAAYRNKLRAWERSDDFKRNTGRPVKD